MTEPTQCPCEFCKHNPVKREPHCVCCDEPLGRCAWANVPQPETPPDTTFDRVQEFFGELPRTPPVTPQSPPKLRRHNAAPCTKLREMIAALNVFK